MFKGFLLATLLFSGYLTAVHLSGGAFYGFGLPLGGDRGEIRRQVVAFWEDIQFKDFKNASSYHAPEKREEVDIPYLLQRLFVQKPEALDIMEYEIVFCKIDSSGKRARIKSRVKVKELTHQKIRNQEVIFYFQRKTLNAPWYMVLEDSLRKLDAEKSKKH